MKWELNTVQNADVNCSTKLLLNTVKSQPFATGWLTKKDIRGENSLCMSFLVFTLYRAI